MAESFNSEKAFRIHYTLWKILGEIPPANNRTSYHIYSIVLTLLITICYPTHLMIGLFYSETNADIFKNLAINLTCLSCSIKTFVIWWKLEKVRKMNGILKRLDQRVNSAAERRYYQHTTYPNVKRVLYSINLICLGAIVSSEGATIIIGLLYEWRLMYPAYFPFEVNASTVNYAIAHLYQFVGVCLQIAQNIASDTFGAVALAMLSGHVHLLGMRISKLGFDAKRTQTRNNAALLEYVQDHRDLLEYANYLYYILVKPFTSLPIFSRLRTLIENIISYCMFIQIILTSANICVTIIYLIFYADNLFTIIYYAVYLFAMPLEIFPTCYFGTFMDLEFEKLTYSILSCNWTSQDKAFRQNLRIFAEQSLRRRTCVAGGMIPITLDSFFAACKGAYSLFAVVMRMK